MFVLTFNDVEAAGRFKVLHGGGVRSARYLTAAHGMGFSLHLNVSRDLPPVELWYKNHWEANYVIAGEVQIVDLATGKIVPVVKGETYQVGPKDRHTFGVKDQASHISVFSPALSGEELHDEDGAYAANGPVPANDGSMFVRSADQMRKAGSEMIVANGDARSIRMITAADEVGFSLSDVNLKAGSSAELWYKHHWEANFIISGTGKVEDLTTGETWPLEPETLYCVGPKDRHRLSADTDLHILSVFCPPLKGDEQHDTDGALEPSGPVPPGPVG